MDYNQKMFSTMSDSELLETNGGGGLLIAGGIVVCVVLIGVGVYNGYKDTKDQKK